LQNLRLIFSLFIYSVAKYHLARWPRAWNSSYLYRLGKWPRALSVIQAFIVAFETAFR